MTERFVFLLPLASALTCGSFPHFSIQACTAAGFATGFTDENSGISPSTSVG